MPNQNSNTDQEELILRYLSGNSTEAEMKVLEDWVLATPENKKQFIAFKKAWMLSALKRNQQEVNVEEMWALTSKELENSTKVIPFKSNRRKWWGLAATLAIVLAASIWFWQLNSKKMQVIAATDTTMQVELPDGSSVTLNRLSKITYPLNGDFGRIVSLDGTAFFDVTENPAKPFRIKTDGVEVKVLGTSFLVDARKEAADIQVIVESGTVEVKSAKEKEVILAGEQATFVKDEQSLAKGTNTDINFQSIKTNTLLFEDTPLEQVVLALNRHYHSNFIIAEDNLTNCRHNGNYQDKSLDTIIEIIAASYTLEKQVQNESIILSGPSCTIN